jgi:glycerol-1-phosphate dehydrogenase [NAD(P)+]
MRAADPIELLLAGQYPDPASGELLRAESRAVVIADSLAGGEADLVTSLDLGTNVAVISDHDTYVVLGERVERALGSRFKVQSIVLGRQPHADVEIVARLTAALDPRTDAVIAVGSGTLNDLAKMVAFERGLPQVVFATAPSMNGYTSVSASITSSGVKRSIRARTPVGVFFDLRVLAAAPVRLIRAGIGDSASRPTAQADWLLSHLLLDRPYREAPFTMLAEDERALFEHGQALVRGDVAAMRYLVRTLVLSGFGMTVCNGSFPASQGEHLLSHYFEMTQPRGAVHAYHGEQIGVCTLAMAAMQDRILARDTPPVLRPTALGREHLVEHFGALAGDGCWREHEQKFFDRAFTEQLNARLATSWDKMRARIRRVTPGANKLRQLLVGAGAPTEPADLGWSPDLLAAAIRYARGIRNRYTFLDFAADTGL